ncbi:zinc ribbon domain-containing protein [bacterium]|nr:zinc ribbon domain-containing protein [bacterium]
MARCPQCGTENPDDSYFCGSCGQQLRSAMERDPGPLSVSAAPEVPATGPDSAAGFTLSPPPATPPAESSPNRINLAPPPQSSAPPAGPYVPGPGQAEGPVTGDPGVSYVPPPGYVPPPSQVPQPPPGYNPYQQFMPQDGNTSGMGTGYQAPPQATGWTFAGFVPWGLFSFFNGNNTWGAIGLGLSLFGFYIVYSIYIGIKGREMAWQERRFESVEQYEAVMKAWNSAGLAVLLIGAGLIALYMVFVFVVMFAGMSGAFD